MFGKYVGKTRLGDEKNQTVEGSDPPKYCDFYLCDTIVDVSTSKGTQVFKNLGYMHVKEPSNLLRSCGLEWHVRCLTFGVSLHPSLDLSLQTFSAPHLRRMFVSNLSRKERETNGAQQVLISHICLRVYL